MASETTSANASVTGTDVKSDASTIESLLAGGERMVLFTVGFGIYPTKRGFIGHSCDSIAFPDVTLLRHRPLLALVKECVEDFDGPFGAVSEDGLITFDLSGFSAAFEGVSGMSRVIDLESTRTGHFPCPVDPKTLDFNLLPDAHTFFQGLTLSPEWRDSPALLASFTFLPGAIGGWPDDLTNEMTSKWGFTDEERDKTRRKTNWTVHVSEGLPTRTIEVRHVKTRELAGWIRVKPGRFGFVLGMLSNGWVDARGEYDKDADEVTVNLSHVEAMRKFCDAVENEEQSVQVDFGLKLPAAVTRREVFTAAANPFIKPDLLEPFVKRIDKVRLLYNSDVNCSGRRMEMSS